MALPVVQYTVALGDTRTVAFKRGPSDFRCYRDARVHDNLASSGAVRERVVEAVDVLITFTMPHLVLGDDLEAWGAFADWWIAGKRFQFSPNSALSDYCTCVAEDTAWQPIRTGPRKFSASVRWRMVADLLTPEVVLKRFNGVAA